MNRCKFEKDYWGLYITPMIGFNRNMPSKKRTFWIGWLFWLWEIEF